MKKQNLISSKINRLIKISILFSVLLLTIIMFNIYNIEKNRTINQLELITEMLSNNIEFTMLHGDQNFANLILKSLEKQSKILNVYVYDADKNVFASYQNKHNERFHKLNISKIYIKKDIMYDNNILGKIFIEANMLILIEDLLKNFIIILFFSLCFLIIFGILSNKLLLEIILPIEKLIKHSKKVSQGVYELIELKTSNEMDELIETFNLMLSNIKINLNKTETLLHTLIESVDTPIFIKSSPDDWFLVNKKYTELTGRSKENGFTTTDNLSDKCCFIEKDRKVFETGVSSKFKTNYTLNGKTYYLITKISRFIDIEGNKYLIGIISDITDITIAQQDLKNSNEMLENILENQQDCIIRVNKRLEIVYANKQHCIVFHDGKNCLGTNITLAIHKEDKRKMFEAKKRLEKGDDDDNEVEIRCKTYRDGWRWFNWKYVRVDDINDETLEIQCVGRDITERKVVEELLLKKAELEKSANEILTMIAYRKDLKEILTNICLHLEKHDPHIKSSILLYNKKDGKLYQGAAPSLPDDYNALLEHGLPIGNNVGTCGVAAYNKKFTITSDLLSTKNWLDYPAFVEKVKKYNLKACWSHPILSSDNELLGTLANYSDVVGNPTEENVKMIEWASTISSMCIEQDLNAKELAKSEEKYKSIVDNLNDCLYQLDIDYNFTYLTKQITNILGYEPEELLGTNFREIFMKTTLEDSIVEFDDMVYDMEIIGEHKNKQIINLEYDMLKLYNEDDEIIGYQGLIRDISQRKKLENEIIEKSKMFLDVTESSPLGIMIMDETYNILYENKQIKKFNLPIKVNNKFNTSIIEDEKLSTTSKDKYLTLDAKINDTWYEFIFKPIIYMNMQCELILINDIHMKRVQTEKLDEEVKKRTHQLDIINKELESFAYVVSHDLKSPMRQLSMISEILLKEYGELIKEKELLYSIKDTTKHSWDLIDGLLRLSSDSRGNIVLKEWLFTDKLIQLCNTLKPKNKEVIIKVHPNMILNCDYKMLMSVYTNLINNAFKFSSDNECIEIEIGSIELEDNVIYFVCDNGVGFKNDIGEKLFDVFQTNKHKYSGTGIGLSTVKRIINKHNGIIWAESIVENDILRGACFYFTLN